MSNWRLAIRGFARNPGFAAVVVLTLALGVGATAAVFSIIDGVLLRPLPYQDPGRLVRLAEGYAGAAPLRTGPRFGNVTYYAWKDAGPKTVTGIEGYTESGDALVESTDGRALTRISLVTPGLFRMLGVSAAVGRLLLDGDAAEGAEPVVVLSERLWRERFAADDAIIGRRLRISGQPHRVAGVAASGFTFPDAGTRLWIVLGIPRPTGPNRSSGFMTFLALARLKPGITPTQAAAEATAVARTIDPKPLAARSTFGEGGAAFVRATPMLEEMTSGIKTALVVITAGIGCILLIACVNASNLLLSRGVARHRELAVRTALGANWGALARQLLTEGLVLSLTGGALGVLLAVGAVRVLPLLAPTDFPRLDNVAINLRVVAVALLVSLLTGAVAALAPIMGIRIDLASAFRGEGGGGVIGATLRSHSRNLLLAAQSSFTMVLLVAAVLLARSFAALIQVDAGYTREGVLIADVLRPDTAQESAQRYASLMRDALERARALPGVTAAAIGSMSPLDSNTSLQAFPVPGAVSSAQLPDGAATPRTALTRSYAVTPGYELAMGLRLKAGRFLEDADGLGSDSRWVVNEEFARLYLPVNPVGRRFPWRRGNQDVQLEIVGIVGNVLKDGNAGTPAPEVYRLLRSTEPFLNYQIVMRTAGDPAAIVPALRRVVREAAPDATVVAVPLSQRFSDAVAQPRLATSVFVALASLGSALTAIGLFAALSYSLSRRRHEFGLRMAVGATRVHLVGLAVRAGMTPSVIGMIVGMIAATGATRLMRGILFGVSELDAASFVAAPLLLIPVTIAASLLPALRASHADPMVTLRQE